MSITALALFSGGLDSILACRPVMAQGVRVVALRFITPFFEADVGDVASFTVSVQEKYGIEVEVIDVSHDYITMLKAPQHGFGRHFNPCIDCKIFMLRQARALMPKYGASFLITGEVIGQRPMSQRRDTLRIIERESGCEGILLRPLCAQLMPPTEPELQGLLNRDQLCRICGRGRSEQQALAAHFSIFDYPAPAGGCLLADVNLAVRFRYFSPGIFAAAGDENNSDGKSSNNLVDDFRLLLFGRHFEPLPGLWFILGRDQKDNERIMALRQPGDWLLHMKDRPGPVGLLRRGAASASALADQGKLEAQLAGLLLRYAKKVEGRAAAGMVRIEREEGVHEATFNPLTDEQAKELML